jgi:glycosyltransferase involved in cell wall biosynthesis
VGLRVAIVSQYFPPEPGATQNRVGTFAEGLAARGHDVTVICEQPNHPAGVYQPGFGRLPIITERRLGVIVRRLWVVTSPHKTTLRRLGFYTSFAVAAGATLLGSAPFDVVFASSPPLPGPLAAGVVARLRDVPFVLDVRDIWPAAAEALGELSSHRTIAAAERAERWLYRAASRVTATTCPFCEHIDRLAGRDVSVHVPNGALDELLDLPLTAASNGTFVVGYTGNLGIAQGLGIVFDAAERLRDENVRFVLVGDGPLSAELRAERDRRGLDQVDIRRAVPVAEIAGVMQDCNALLVPLRAHPLLADFVPSKLYDAMAVGRPAIVAAHGEAAALLRGSGAGIAIAPEDGPALAEAIRALAHDPHRAAALGEAGRRAAPEHARSLQIGRLERILADAAGARPEPMTRPQNQLIAAATQAGARPRRRVTGRPSAA